MKKLIYSLLFLITSQHVYAQVDSVSLALQPILSEKNDVTRIQKLYHDSFFMIDDNDPLKGFARAQRLLVVAQKLNDKHIEAFAMSQIGWAIGQTQSPAKRLEYNLKALKIAEPLNNPELLAIIKRRIAVDYSLQQSVGLNYERAAYDEATKAGDDRLKAWIVFGIGRTLYEMKEFDSSLFYLHIAEQLMLKHNIDKTFTFFALGDTYAEMKNPKLALAYYNLAITEATGSNSPTAKSRSFVALAEYYYKTNETDSAVVYARKAIAILKSTPYQSSLLRPAKLLTDFYRNKNNDSAMKYSDMYAMANDIQNSSKVIRETELLTFEEQLRQEGIAKEKLKMEDQRHQNIQYASVAIGIIVFIIAFLLLSRSIVVNERFISFFAVLAFLVFFEFVNLLIHSWLADFTHESPLLMLLALVFIAAFLIQFRTKMEPIVKEKLVAKNKAIRLAAAKKTIAKLEK